MANVNEILIKKNGNQVKLEMPTEEKEVLICINSTANENIFEYSDISPYTPSSPMSQAAEVFDKDWAIADDAKRNAPIDLRFPVVDIEVQKDMQTVIEIDKKEDGKLAFNGNFNLNYYEIKEKHVFSSDITEHWDNSVQINPNTNKIKKFYVQTTVKSENGKVEFEFNTLRPDWSGSVSVYTTDESKKLLGEVGLVAVGANVEGFKEKGYTQKHLLESLSWTIKFILKCRNMKEDSTTFGGVYLLYDMAAKTYLRSDWPWSWGPAATLLLRASELDGLDIGMSKEELKALAFDIADATLEQQILDETNPAYGLVRTTDEPGTLCEHGFRNRASNADTLYLTGWTWMPFYTATKDVKYLEATKKVADKVGIVLSKYEGSMIPQTYDLKEEAWSGHMFFETSMGLGGLGKLAVETKDQKYIDILKDFVTRLLNAFEREDGLWETWVHQGTEGVAKCNYFTKSFGYCVEGLMAVHDAFPEDGYLKRATVIADHILKAQYEDGSWAVRWDRPWEEVGKDDKGTSLWALLYLRLFKATGEEKYKEAGMKALHWCIDNQYFGEDENALGGIVGRSWPSGVIYRYWFDMITSYTMSFFGNALVEAIELGLYN